MDRAEQDHAINSILWHICICQHVSIHSNILKCLEQGSLYHRNNNQPVRVTKLLSLSENAFYWWGERDYPSLQTVWEDLVLKLTHRPLNDPSYSRFLEFNMLPSGKRKIAYKCESRWGLIGLTRYVVGVFCLGLIWLEGFNLVLHMIINHLYFISLLTLGHKQNLLWVISVYFFCVCSGKLCVCHVLSLSVCHVSCLSYLKHSVAPVPMKNLLLWDNRVYLFFNRERTCVQFWAKNHDALRIKWQWLLPPDPETLWDHFLQEMNSSSSGPDGLSGQSVLGQLQGLLPNGFGLNTSKER